MGSSLEDGQSHKVCTNCSKYILDHLKKQLAKQPLTRPEQEKASEDNPEKLESRQSSASMKSDATLQSTRAPEPSSEIVTSNTGINTNTETQIESLLVEARKTKKASEDNPQKLESRQSSASMKLDATLQSTRAPEPSSEIVTSNTGINTNTETQIESLLVEARKTKKASEDNPQKLESRQSSASMKLDATLQSTRAPEPSREIVTSRTDINTNTEKLPESREVSKTKDFLKKTKDMQLVRSSRRTTRSRQLEVLYWADLSRPNQERSRFLWNKGVPTWGEPTTEAVVLSMKQATRQENEENVVLSLEQALGFSNCSSMQAKARRLDSAGMATALSGFTQVSLSSSGGKHAGSGQQNSW
eukprot:TRINITY_DN20129_c0_g1_i7.p1 TRINITY_DN20129_c0_g1~~TRINITY_DN20129_c0_g1_i7.p1  ORF type:complete len:407 (-),score=42.39 TRINITY_DN20129_c0_g1_i7:69-1145(-)